MDNTNFILEPADVLTFEASICAFFKRFINFKDHAFYFPDDDQDAEIKILTSEKSVLVPLLWNNKILGILILKGVNARETKRAAPFLRQIAEASLQLASCERALQHDSKTDLATEEKFFMRIVNEARQLRGMLADPSQTLQQNFPLYKMCLGMIVISWHDAHKFAHEFDYEFCEHVHTRLAKALLNEIPSDSLAAPLGRYEGRYEFGIVFTASGRMACQKLAKQILDKLESIEFIDAPSGRIFHSRLYAGHSLYPQDMLGEELRLPMLEQALRLRDRARFASRLAKNLGGSTLPERILAFGKILLKAGRIIKILGGGKVKINLGVAANASEGMRFQVLGQRKEDGKIFTKCYIVLLETRIKDAIAEIFHMEEAGEFPEIGDYLLLVDSSTPRKERAKELDIAPLAELENTSQLLSHAEFLTKFARENKKYSRFILAIARLKPDRDEKSEQIDSDSGKFSLKLPEFFNGIINEHREILPDFAGHYGSHGIICFHGGKNCHDCLDFYHNLANFAADNNCEYACGMFSYPFLDFSRTESENCALKALEYALLLPKPHIGIFDSLALNISADKKYSLGDAFGAIEEYQNAILADPRNAMAKNSLGVCLAALGKTEEARKLFLDAQSLATEKSLQAKILYNLGTLYQKQNDLKQAKYYFCQCIKTDNAYFFAWLKMGKVYERMERNKAARAFYRQAAKLAGDNAELANMAKRHLALIEAKSSGIKTAKALLHDALLRDPYDTASMSLLAKLYLDDKEDPAIAEMLARKSVNLQGGAEAWQILASALAAQGKEEEALKAQQRADKEFYND